jgi:ABC-type transporter Mla MlaB component
VEPTAAVSPGARPGGIALEEEPVRQLRFTGTVTKDVVRDFRVRVRPQAWPSRVDLSGVDALDGACVELLLHLARKQKRFGGELEVVEPPEPLRRVLEQSGLTRVSHWVDPDADAPPPGPSVATA